MKNVRTVFLAFLITVVLILTAGASLYWYNWNQNVPAEITAVEALPGKVKIGEPVTVNLEIITPWYRQVENSIQLTEDSTDNIALSGDIKIHNEGYTLNSIKWRASFKIILFDEGKYENVKAVIPLSADREKKQNFLTAELPELEAVLTGLARNSIIESKGELDESALKTHDEITAERTPAWLWFTGAALLAALAALPFLLKRSLGNITMLSSWDTAINQLQSLKQESDLSDEIFFVRLSDILRQYIEKRFSLPATEKTTEEFMQQIQKGQKLSEKQQSTLRNFLSTADLVKFAKMSADSQLRDTCLMTADKFIHETVPKEEVS